LLFSGVATFGQAGKIWVLPSVHDGGDISIIRTQLESHPDHPFNVNFEIYNVVWQGEGKQGLLATFTVLPDKVSRRAEFVKKDNFKPRQDSQSLLEILRKEAVERIENTKKTVNRRSALDLSVYSKSLHSVLLVERNGKWYESKSPLLVEFYEVSDYPKAFAGTECISEINLSSPEFSFGEFMLYKKEILNVPDVVKSIDRIESLAGRIFLEESRLDKGEELYSYWSTPPLGFDYPDYISGIGSFVYSPKKGIIAGSYDFYFNRWYDDYYKKLKMDLKFFKRYVKHENLLFEEKN